MNRTTEPQTSSTVSFFYAVLAGYFLFAHGCHGGDEDHELSLMPGLNPSFEVIGIPAVEEVDGEFESLQ